MLSHCNDACSRLDFRGHAFVVGGDTVTQSLSRTSDASRLTMYTTHYPDRSRFPQNSPCRNHLLAEIVRGKAPSGLGFYERHLVWALASVSDLSFIGRPRFLPDSF